MVVVRDGNAITAWEEGHECSMPETLTASPAADQDQVLALLEKDTSHATWPATARPPSIDAAPRNRPPAAMTTCLPAYLPTTYYLPRALDVDAGTHIRISHLVSPTLLACVPRRDSQDTTVPRRRRRRRATGGVGL